jgi:hypothetical protein
MPKAAFQASDKLLPAPHVPAGTPLAMRLPYLQTQTAITGDKASTIVSPGPIDRL